MKSKAFYILGGMGPEASSYLFNLLIELSIKEFGARNNNDFPEIILHSVPVPDFISSDQAKRKALDMLKESVRQVNKLNISCISIACNTAHILLEPLQAISAKPFVSMIDEVVKSVLQSRIKVVGVMGTPSILRYRIYQKALEAAGVTVIIPSENQIRMLEKIIRNVLAGKEKVKDKEKLISIVDSLQRKGAQGIILGCTELPLVFPKQYSLPVFNSVEILARALLSKYYK